MSGQGARALSWNGFSPTARASEAQHPAHDALRLADSLGTGVDGQGRLARLPTEILVMVRLPYLGRRTAMAPVLNVHLADHLALGSRLAPRLVPHLALFPLSSLYEACRDDMETRKERGGLA